MKDNERKINIDDVLVHSAKFIKDNFIPKKNEESFNIKKKDDKTNVFCIIGEACIFYSANYAAVGIG